MLFEEKERIIKEIGKGGWNMKRKIMACILAAALGITGVSFPTAAKTVSVGKNVKNITVNVKNPLDELRAQEAAMQQQEELEEEENMPEQDLDPLVLDNDGSVVPASQASWTKIESGAVEAVDVSETPGDEEVSENSTEDTFSDGSTDGDFDTNKNTSDNAAAEAGSEDIQTADGSISGELPADFSEGTENGDNGSEASSEDALSQTICQGLGGKKNISDVDCCATRLRCTVQKAECVDDALLKSTGASGVVHKGNGVQIIYGPRVSVIKSNLEDYLETAPDEEFTAGGNDVDATAHVGVDTNVDGGANAGVAENANTSSAEATVVETIVISSPITGLAADLSTTPDEAFAGKMMGDGAVVTPEDSVVRAPEDGEVCFVFETKHAIGFLTDSGVSLLIHMGIDTVALNGEGFEVFVENGQKVKKGEPLLSLNLDYLKENAPSLASPVLCTELEDNQKVRLLKDGQIKAGEALFAIDIYE